MKKRTLVILMCAAVGSSLFSGCAKTPESSLVKQKGEKSMKNYEEGASLEEQAEKAEAGDTVEMEISEKEEGENPLRLALHAPETYKSEVSDETGKLKIITDAAVEIPEADKVSAVNVSQHPVDQAFIDKVTETFFPDAKIYSAESWYAKTKDEWLAQLEELKGYAAEGNLDPYNFGTDENGNPVYDIYGAIERVQENYENAPEERTPVEVKPQYGQYSDDKGNVWQSDFQGIAVTEDGSPYRYQISSYGSMPMEVEIAKFGEKERMGNLYWSEFDAMHASNEKAPELKEVKDNIGISLEKAKEMADEKVEALSLSSMELTDWEYGILWDDGVDISQESTGYSKEKQVAYGYVLHYTRKINNIPITYTLSWGGALENMDSEMETWGYERLNFYITKEGINRVEFCNQYDIGDVKTENLALKPFDEIMEIYEKMMLIQNADIINYESYRTYYVNRITFGYTRIYEPASDSRSGLLVPVWNFFGRFELGHENDGEFWNGVNADRYQSYLTVNAVDGSIIDMELGY